MQTVCREVSLNNYAMDSPHGTCMCVLHSINMLGHTQLFIQYWGLFPGSLGLQSLSSVYKHSKARDENQGKFSKLQTSRFDWQKRKVNVDIKLELRMGD